MENKLTRVEKRKEEIKLYEDKNVIKFRNGILRASSRTYGEKIMEPIIRFVLGFKETQTDENDACDEKGKTYEIKCSKVLRQKENNKNISFIDKVLNENFNDEVERVINSDDFLIESYLSNIQNVKRDHFSTLVYVLLFEDCIKIFKEDKENIYKLPNWSDKHGRYDAIGKSGQFGINNKNIEWHVKNNIVSTLSWEEVYTIVKNNF